MKRIVLFILTVLLACPIAIHSYAAMPEEVEPLYNEINSLYANLDISSLGVATCTGRITAKQLDSVKVIVRLQQDTGTSWKTLKSWSSSGTATAYASGSYAVYKGYTYRVSVSGYVYDTDDTILETDTLTYEVDY